MALGVFRQKYKGVQKTITLKKYLSSFAYIIVFYTDC